MLVERDVPLRCMCPRESDRNGKDCVGAEARLVLRSIEVDQRFLVAATKWGEEAAG